MTNIFRRSIALLAFAATAITANANSLQNPSFESGTASNTDPNAANWVQFNDAFRTSTNTTAFPLTAHSGAFSMKTYGPFNALPDASGAYQAVPTSSGQNWRLTGYCLNWQNDPLLGPNSFGAGESSYGAGELIFLDNTGGTGNVLQVVDGPHYGSEVVFPLNVWQFFEVDGTAPSGTANVRAQVIHVGNGANPGSVYWDDLNLYQPTGVVTTNGVIVQPAVQISWPTTAPTSNTTVNAQVQSITNLVFSNQTASNVLVNPGFETDAVSNAANGTTITGWSIAGGRPAADAEESSYPNPTHSGIGALRLYDNSTAVPVVFQGNPGSPNLVPVTPGQVWDLQGYAYVSSNDSPIQSTTYGLIKIVWTDASGNQLQPVSPDTNSLGTVVTGGNPGIESSHVTAGSPQNTWIHLEARGTVPTGAAFVEDANILVGFSPGGAMRFDDLALTQPVSLVGWQNLGPEFPGNGSTNTIFDPIGANRQKFYRVTTP